MTDSQCREDSKCPLCNRFARTAHNPATQHTPTPERQYFTSTNTHVGKHGLYINGRLLKRKRSA